MSIAAAPVLLLLALALPAPVAVSTPVDPKPPEPRLLRIRQQRAPTSRAQRTAFMMSKGDAHESSRLVQVVDFSHICDCDALENQLRNSIPGLD